MLPFRAPFSTAADILESKTEDSNDIYVDYRPDFLELTPEAALEKYQLTAELRGTNEITGTKILNEIHVLDRGSEEVYDTFHVDDLAEDHFIERLSEVDGVDSSLAELLIDEYTNLRTISWATTSDVTHLENTWDIDAHSLFEELQKAGVYRNEHSPDSGVLQMPERVKKEYGLEEDEQEDEDGEETEQIGLTDF
ncbi:hypothetical protein [Halorarum halobium]|uniref:hypothetical protein n=1 Tax=Halorarum halobium TaxID=3075121 RepID=UPI0028A7679B|nr:hypothetical protein [Halobaculum sp. XH14]